MVLCKKEIENLLNLSHNHQITLIWHEIQEIAFPAIVTVSKVQQTQRILHQPR